MNSRERVFGAINRTPIDRVPRFDAFWEDTIELYVNSDLKLPPQKTMEVDGKIRNIGNPIEEYFNYDIECLYMDISMRFDAKLVSDDGEQIVVQDRAGYTAQKFKGRASSLHFISHKVENKADWEEHKHRLKFDPKDEARIDCAGYFLRTEPYPSWAGAKKIFDEYRTHDKYLAAFVYGPYESTWRHHGFETCLMDLAWEPEMMGEMLDKSADVLIDTVQYMIDNDMKVDAIWVAEDMGGTHTTLFSREMYRETLFPRHKRIGDFLKKNGIHFIMHSCGKIEPFLPDLIEAGVEVIQALQANTGMHVGDLKEKFGDKLTFFGNIGETSFRDGKETVEAELRDKVPKAMVGGGFIYHSDHSIPPEVDLETYEYAMKVLDEIGNY